jgi:hypothetical protein
MAFSLCSSQQISRSGRWTPSSTVDAYALGKRHFARGQEHDMLVELLPVDHARVHGLLKQQDQLEEYELGATARTIKNEVVSKLEK